LPFNYRRKSVNFRKSSTIIGKSSEDSHEPPRRGRAPTFTPKTLGDRPQVQPKMSLINNESFSFAIYVGLKLLPC